MKKAVTCKIADGFLRIKIPIIDPPDVSSSGKNYLLATTRGPVKTGVTVEGEEVSLNLNAFFKVKKQKKSAL